MAEPTRCLIFDPFSGISGDMILGALLDLGVPLEWLRELVSALPLADVSVETRRVTRGTISAAQVIVKAGTPQPARHLEDVLQVVDAAPVPHSVRETAATVFRRLAEVEGALHGVSPDRVHFHEVGAADALVDVIASTAGIHELGVERCFTRPVAIGRGWVRAAHGELPLPAPATLKLLEGLPLREVGEEAEMTTPTGAVLLSVLTGGQPAPGVFIPTRSGFGAGARDPSSRPNCLRLILADLKSTDCLYLLQADLDDMAPEYLVPLRDALMEAGATEVWQYTVQMKKGRTGVRIEALVADGQWEEVARAFFQNSTTLGLRFWPVERQVLPRTTNTIEWRGFPIRIKTSRRILGHVIRKPEYDDVVRAARALGIPPLEARREIERLLDAGG